MPFFRGALRRLLDEILMEQREEIRLLREILKQLQTPPPVKHYTVRIQQLTPRAFKGVSMADPAPSGIVTGGSGTFNAVLLDNGTAVATQPTTWTWSTNDASGQITIANDPSDPSGATVIVSVPAGDTTQSVVITAQTMDPSGTPVSGNVVVPITGALQTFTVQITQTK